MTPAEACEERLRILQQVLALTLSVRTQQADLPTLSWLLGEREKLIARFPPRPDLAQDGDPILAELDTSARELVTRLIEHDVELTRTMELKRNKVRGLMRRANHNQAYSNPTMKSWVG